MNVEKEIEAIDVLLTESKEHGLQAECVWTLIHEVVSLAINNREVDSLDIEQSCNNALCEWDI